LVRLIHLANFRT